MNRTSGNRRIARNVAIVAIVLGLWVGLVLLFAAPLALTSSASWRQTVRFGVSFWALWLVFLPAVVWLSFRFPIERRRVLRNVALHLLACLLVVGANRVVSRAYTRFSLAPPRSEAPGPPPANPDKPERQDGRPRVPPPRAPGPPDSRNDRVGPPGAFGVFLALRAALDVLVFWSVVGVCQAVRNFRRSQERERLAAELEASLTTAKLQALRMQLNPHFLFNTLNSIAALVYINPRAADEMLGDLSELLRLSLDSMNEQEVPLSRELEFVGTYISIEQKRFGERLRVEQSVPDELMKALVPALILQPLVENAIRHGIEPRRGPGLISIEARKDDNHLHLIVRDDGRGLLGADANSAARRGIGLGNTQARLQGLYGQNQSFTFGKAEPRGCRVDIRLPFHVEPVDVPAVSNQPAA